MCGLRDYRPGFSATHIRSALLPKRDRLFLFLQTLPGPLPLSMGYSVTSVGFLFPEQGRPTLPGFLPTKPW